MFKVISASYMAVIALLFLFFFHGDITYIAHMSLSYLFRNPLDFYEAASEYIFMGNKPAANYFPTIFILLALAFLPLKLIGVIQSPEIFNIYLVYYVKLILLGIFYLAGKEIKNIIFALGGNGVQANSSKWIFLMSPFAIFSVLIFSQVDIVYVYLILIGIKHVIYKKYSLFSLLLGIAFTIKFFSLIPFILILLYVRKKPFEIIKQIGIFMIPIIFFTLAYWNSINFQKGVLGWGVKDYLFMFTVTVNPLFGGWVLSIFIVLIVIASLSIYTLKDEIYPEILLFIFMFSSFLVFLTSLWHPQWIVLISPPIALALGYLNANSSIMNVTTITFFGFIGTVFTFYHSNVDMAMFRGPLFFIPFNYQFLVKDLIDFYPPYSFLIYYSIFWAGLTFLLYWTWNEIKVKKEKGGKVN